MSILIFRRVLSVCGCNLRYVVDNGFISSDTILALGSFCNKVSTVRLFTNDAGLPVSMVALNSEPLVFSVVLRHLVFPVAELITSRFLTVSVCRDVSEIFRTE